MGDSKTLNLHKIVWFVDEEQKKSLKSLKGANALLNFLKGTTLKVVWKTLI